MAALVLALATTAPAPAHHSFSAEYDIDRPITITGVLSRIEWINPHSFIDVDVKAADGSVTTWVVEFGAPNTLLRRGVRKTDFPVGGEVTVKGYRAKSGKPVIAGTNVKLPDGRDFFAGSEGTGNPDDPTARRPGSTQ
jgi:hypothetical protein